ncbi:MAG: hypothetical protein LBF66_03000 [Holosporales bacterium]|jgi:hypothetical protein|nr:hypothetical protein [Holosporales bacterium]
MFRKLACLLAICVNFGTGWCSQAANDGPEDPRPQRIATVQNRYDFTGVNVHPKIPAWPVSTGRPSFIQTVANGLALFAIDLSQHQSTYGASLHVYTHFGWNGKIGYTKTRDGRATLAREIIKREHDVLVLNEYLTNLSEFVFGLSTVCHSGTIRDITFEEDGSRVRAVVILRLPNKHDVIRFCNGAPSSRYQANAFTVVFEIEGWNLPIITLYPIPDGATMQELSDEERIVWERAATI